jgi:hypothetical protein
MASKRKPIGLKIASDGDQRFLVTTYSDGEETRERIIKQERKVRKRNRVPRSAKLDRSRKKGF